MTEQYQQGWQAALAGLRPDSNPYRKDGSLDEVMKSIEWMSGYIDALYRKINGGAT